MIPRPNTPVDVVAGERRGDLSFRQTSVVELFDVAAHIQEILKLLLEHPRRVVNTTSVLTKKNDGPEADDSSKRVDEER